MDPLDSIKQHLDRTDDPTLLILRAHLLLEERFRDSLARICRSPEELPGARLSFLCLLKNPSGSKMTQKRTRASALPVPGRDETSRIASGITSLRVDRVKCRRTFSARIENMCHIESGVSLPGYRDDADRRPGVQ